MFAFQHEGEKAVFLRDVGLENPRETDADRAYLNELDSAPDADEHEALDEIGGTPNRPSFEDENDREYESGDRCPKCHVAILRERRFDFGQKLRYQVYCPRCSSDSNGD